MFLSIIIPVYNAEEYLDECLRSMLEQQDIPLTEYELVCVNDGSADGSLEILKQYGGKYPNVAVIDQKNGGVTRARNAGLDRAKGDYVWFVDSDDYIVPNCLGMLKTLTEQSGCDRLIVGQDVFHDVCGHTGTVERVFENRCPWFDSVVSRSLLGREFLLRNDLRFHYPELTYGEDALMVYEIKRCLPKTSEISQVLYCYRNHAGTAVTGESAQAERKRLRSNIREAQIMKKYYVPNDPVPVETANRLMSFLWQALYRIAQLPPKEAESYLEELKSSGLFPYHRIKACTITQCFHTAQTGILRKIVDWIYIHIHTRWGYGAMRLWFAMGKLKRKLRG